MEKHINKKINTKLSIVQLTCNRFEILQQYLPKLMEDEIIRNSEYILVDQSEDNRSNHIEEYVKNFPNIKYIRKDENLGVGGWNIGAKEAHGEILLLLDDDVYQIEDSVKFALNYLNQNNEVAALAPQILNSKNKLQWPKYIEDKSQVIGFTGCAWFVRRELFVDVGLFPQEYFLFHNEYPVAALIILKGYKVVYCKEIKFFHMAPPTQRLNNWRLYYFVRNYIWNMVRFSPWYLLPVMLFYGLTEYLIKAIVLHLDLRIYIKAALEGFFYRPKKLKRQALSGKNFNRYELNLIFKSLLGLF